MSITVLSQNVITGRYPDVIDVLGWISWRLVYKRRDLTNTKKNDVSYNKKRKNSKEYKIEVDFTERPVRTTKYGRESDLVLLTNSGL